MKWLEAIVSVMKCVKEPMHYAQIADAVVKGGLVKGGKTPAATANACITVNLKKATTVFIKGERGFYSLKGEVKS